MQGGQGWGHACLPALPLLLTSCTFSNAVCNRLLQAAGRHRVAGCQPFVPFSNLFCLNHHPSPSLLFQESTWQQTQGMAGGLLPRNVRIGPQWNGTSPNLAPPCSWQIFDKAHPGRLQSLHIALQCQNLPRSHTRKQQHFTATSHYAGLLLELPLAWQSAPHPQTNPNPGTLLRIIRLVVLRRCHLDAQ